MKRIIADIGDHFMDRILQLTEDTCDTAGHADMTWKETKAMIAGVMAVSCAQTCSEFGMSRETFLQLCTIAYESRAPKPRRRIARRTQ